MADLTDPHDRFFKAVFSHEEIAEDFLFHHLPAEIAALLVPGKLEISKDSFIDPELKHHYSDLLYNDELPERITGILSLLKDLPRQQSGLDYLHTVLRYLSRGGNKLNNDQLTHAVQQTFERGEAIMSTIADEWIREGEKKGLLEGISQGLTKGLSQGLSQGISHGEMTLLKRQLTRRFGTLPAWAEAKLNQAGQLQLEAWADRILDAVTLESVFEE